LQCYIRHHWVCVCVCVCVCHIELDVTRTGWPSRHIGQSHRGSHTEAVTQRQSHRGSHTEAVTQRQSGSHTEAVTQRQSHRGSHTEAVTQRQSHRDSRSHAEAASRIFLLYFFLTSPGLQPTRGVRARHWHTSANTDSMRSGRQAAAGCRRGTGSTKLLLLIIIII
jgi:transcription initiation factor TFIIIB Brf1 subunit/transcription initiation factor TFIIB